MRKYIIVNFRNINPSKKVLQFKRNWYHWKAWLFLFTMICHLPWLCNHGMCSTPEYRAKSEVKCCKMHCFQHRSLHFFWRCNVFWIVPRWQCMSCMNVNCVMFFSLKDENVFEWCSGGHWWRVERHPTASRDEAGEQHEEEVVVAVFGSSTRYCDLLRCNHFSIKEGERERERERKTILCVSSLFCH